MLSEELTVRAKNGEFKCARNGLNFSMEYVKNHVINCLFCRDTYALISFNTFLITIRKGEYPTPDSMNDTIYMLEKVAQDNIVERQIELSFVYLWLTNFANSKKWLYEAKKQQDIGKIDDEHKKMLQAIIKKLDAY